MLTVEIQKKLHVLLINYKACQFKKNFWKFVNFDIVENKNSVAINIKSISQWTI